MIVKNEENALARCLDSVREIADEIVIVDTGSTDRTREIAKGYGCRIVDFIWKDHFADARNFAFRQAEGEYILWLDADDVFEEKDRQQLLQWKERLDPSIDGLSMEYHLAFDGSGNVSHKLRRNRLVRKERGFQWHGAVHEYLAVSGNIVHTDIAVTHKKEKEYTDRNLRIYKRLEEQGTEFTARDEYYYANELRDHGLNEDAVRWYTRFLDSGNGWVEDNLSACLRLAECEGKLGNKTQELAALLRSFAYAVPRAEACCRVGAYFAERMEWDKAIHWYETAVDLKRPADPLANIDESSWTWIPHLQLCVCYDRLGNLEQANYHNELALSYHPSHPSMLYNQKYLREKLQDRVLR
ncbi:glycosyltransferase family 2 protein [Neobacillus mesonae]|nr:glycosyltransferase family 2 protein [Neobacillus mesonae]